MRQAKLIGLKTGSLNVVDNMMYKRPYQNQQIMVDAANLTVVEYFTRDQLNKLVGASLNGLSEEQKYSVLNIAAAWSQDMALQRLSGSRKRSAVESLVAFGISEVVAEKAQENVQILQ